MTPFLRPHLWPAAVIEQFVFLTPKGRYGNVETGGEN